jgi:hypothetical protein
MAAEIEVADQSRRFNETLELAARTITSGIE